jgi:hypothetical protein
MTELVKQQPIEEIASKVLRAEMMTYEAVYSPDISPTARSLNFGAAILTERRLNGDERTQEDIDELDRLLDLWRVGVVEGKDIPARLW